MTATTPAPLPAGPPGAPPTERFRRAYYARAETDYYFDGLGMVIFLTVITCGIYGFYVTYQLVRRSRDHNRRRLELLDSATEIAWQQAYERGIAEELRPNFERIALHLGVLRQMTTDFRDPGIWVALAVLSGSYFISIAEVVAFVLLDGDLIRHDQAEGAAEAELAAVFARLGQSVPVPDPARVKGKQNYPGRIVATFFTCTIYGLWWTYNQMDDMNKHFLSNWPWEDALAGAVQALAPVE
ncbi:MAG: DUF4234 domain-containing protein [Acidimicrobiia bacterium]